MLLLWLFCRLTRLDVFNKFFEFVLNRFIQITCAHPSLGRSQVLADFLDPSYSTPHDKSNRKGIFAKFAENFETKKAPVNRDIEEFFQNERDWSSNYSTQLKLVLNSVLTVIHAEKSNQSTLFIIIDYLCLTCLSEITGQLKHLCTALSMNTPTCEETSLINHQLHSQMGLSFLSIKVSLPNFKYQNSNIKFFLTNHVFAGRRR